MKKILFLLGIVLLCGCTDPDAHIRTSSINTIPFQYVTHFEYKNHKYIKFTTDGLNSATGGVVHDPDCKYCNKK